MDENSDLAPKAMPLEEKVPQEPEPCPICNGAGWVCLDVPYGHRYFGKAVPCKCQAERIKARRMRKLWEQSGLTEEEIKTYTFQTFIPEEVVIPARANKEEIVQAMRDIKRACIAYAMNPQGWLVLQGEYGTGKTHLALAILKFCLEHGLTVFKATVPEMLDLLRPHTLPDGSMIDSTGVMDTMQQVELLVLDDLDKIKVTAWVEERLHVLLDKRYRLRLPTVFTTNANVLDVNPMIPAYLRSRMRDGVNMKEGAFCKIYTMPCGSYREREG